MFIVNDDPLAAGLFVCTQVLVNTPVTAPATAHTTCARLSRGQMLDEATVIEGKHLAGNCDVEKAK